MPSVDEQQLELFREEGGLLTGNAKKDPVSGNDVPPGSRPEEVRDDIPAMLSENEYVVPADVVRFFGVKFFEDLRGQAKSGMMDMERGGRIGGEPVDPTPGDEDLTPEELQMLAEITGMYAGGDVRRPERGSISVDEVLSSNLSVYDIINSPMSVHLGDGSKATSPEMKRELFKRMGLIQIADASGMYSGGMVRKGYQEGGMVNQPFVPTPNYTTPGFSLFQPPQVATPTPPAQTLQAVTLYGPNGEIATLTLPTDQARYDALLGQGYSTQQRVQQPVVEPGGEGGDRGEEDFVFNVGDDRESSPLRADMYEALNADPLAYGQSMLEKQDFSRLAGGLGSAALGPVGGLVSGAVAAGFTANNVAQARAAVEIAKSRGLDTTQLEKNINSYVASLPNAARMMAEITDGSRIVERFNNQTTPPTTTTAAPRTPAAPRTTTSGDREVGMTPRPSADPFAGMSVADLLPPPREESDRPTSWEGGRVAENQSKPTATSPSESRASAQRAAERQGTSLATRGRAKGGLVSRPEKNKPVAKKK
jgi:hypothetical protein